ncbi:hypothetical protein A6A27_13875 [Micromonospora sp. CB01531]|nr:hypothetical protein A6A27_13875 [Micromonospora sp. CB01531]
MATRSFAASAARSAGTRAGAEPLTRSWLPPSVSALIFTSFGAESSVLSRAVDVACVALLLAANRLRHQLDLRS